MSREMVIALAQMNPTVGALEANAAKIAKLLRKAKELGAELVVFPEMAITGYPTNDLLFESRFVEENERLLEEVVRPATEGLTAVVGYVRAGAGLAPAGNLRRLHNAAAVMSDGKLLRVVNKTLLPNYDVFDERRYFQPGSTEEIAPVDTPLAGGLRIGVQICEDLWDEGYGADVSALLCRRGAEMLVNINASPFYAGRQAEREEQMRSKALGGGIPFVYVNMVGGQDELVFDGRSLVMDGRGRAVCRAADFEEALAICRFKLDEEMHEAPPFNELAEEEIIRAHTLNLRDYFEKQRIFKGIAVGSSGGIDSAYTIYIASRAVGPERVLSVAMPSMYSSGHSKSDAARLAENLGVRHMEIPIQDMYEAGLKTFLGAFGETPFSVAEENDQARCRMMILMKISKKFDYLICTTGNKSELSAGYWTLYGDGGGGKNVPGDLYKVEIYRVAKYINRDREIIPQNIIDKEPSAELAPNQKDSDSLPPYPVLDAILRLLVEERLTPAEVAAEGFDPAVVERVARLYRNTEFKRDQMPRGIKVSRKAYGAGRRIPITNHWAGPPEGKG